MNTDPARGRIDLWLRSERALGLDSVAVSPAIAMRSKTTLSKPRAAVAPAIARPESDESEGVLIETPDRSPFTSPVLSREEKIAKLKVMDEKEVKVCKLCRLCQTRTNTVFGEGDPDTKIFFIGEGPGETEDNTGRPFVGRAGELLNKMIAGMGLRRDQVFIANIVKCRPPANRVPAPDEVETCTPYLVRQLEIIRPKVIVTLGHPSAKYMLETKETMGRLRGRWHMWRGIKLMPTFHPAYLLRAYTPENRAMVWSDLQAVMSEVGLSIPKKKND